VRAPEESGPIYVIEKSSRDGGGEGRGAGGGRRRQEFLSLFSITKLKSPS